MCTLINTQCRSFIQQIIFEVYSLVCYGILAEVEEKAHTYVITKCQLNMSGIKYTHTLTFFYLKLVNFSHSYFNI